jgi:hypothetical protein
MVHTLSNQYHLYQLYDICPTLFPCTGADAGRNDSDIMRQANGCGWMRTIDITAIVENPHSSFSDPFVLDNLLGGYTPTTTILGWANGTCCAR